MTSSDQKPEGASLSMAQRYQECADRLFSAAQAEGNAAMKSMLMRQANHWQSVANFAIADVQVNGGRYHNY